MRVFPGNEFEVALSALWLKRNKNNNKNKTAILSLIAHCSSVTKVLVSAAHDTQGPGVGSWGSRHVPATRYPIYSSGRSKDSACLCRINWLRPSVITPFSPLFFFFLITCLIWEII